MSARIFVSAAIALAIAYCNIAPGHAEEPQAKDLTAMQNCLKSKGHATRELEACIDVVAKPCIGDEGARAPSEVIACLDRERLVWDQLLNAAYQKLQKNLEDDQRNKLRDMQRSWLDTRERTCAFYYHFFQGTMANPMMANCQNREIARRAIYLMGFADDLAQDEKGK
jgi:uncharacterized protein YecT (DUF1311 family)